MLTCYVIRLLLPHGIYWEYCIIKNLYCQTLFHPLHVLRKIQTFLTVQQIENYLFLPSTHLSCYQLSSLAKELILFQFGHIQKKCYCKVQKASFNRSKNSSKMSFWTYRSSNLPLGPRIMQNLDPRAFFCCIGPNYEEKQFLSVMTIDIISIVQKEETDIIQFDRRGGIP